MHGLINRSIQCFLRDTYGAATWAAVAREARLGFDSFETMLTYDAALTEAVITAATQVLGRPRDSVPEDLGIYLVYIRMCRRPGVCCGLAVCVMPISCILWRICRIAPGWPCPISTCL